MPVIEEPWQHAEAVAHTAALMSNAGVPSIFEAAFAYDGNRIRVEMMERLAPGAWGLREVKCSSGLKDQYLDDIALQVYVLRGGGDAVEERLATPLDHAGLETASRRVAEASKFRHPTAVRDEKC